MGILIFSIIIILLVLVLTFQNLTLAPLTLIWTTVDAPVGLVMIVSFLAGVIVLALIILPHIFTKGRQISKIEKEKHEMQLKLDASGIDFESEGLGKEGAFRD